MKQLKISQPVEAHADVNARALAQQLKSTYGADPVLVVTFDELRPKEYEATPQLEVQIDMVVRDSSFAGGYMPHLAFSSNDGATHALTCGHRMGKDMFGVFPCLFREDLDLGEGLWASVESQDYLSRLTGLDEDQLSVIRDLPAGERLEAARRLYPEIQAVWHKMRAEASQACLLGDYV